MTDTLPISELTPAGLQELRAVVSAAPGLSIPELKRRLTRLAGETAMSQVLDEKVRVPVFPELETRHDTAALVRKVLDGAGIQAGPSQTRESVFAWLAAVFLPALCRRTSAGSCAPGNLSRYIPTRSSRDFYRNLVAGPYWLLEKHGNHARIFLSQEAYVMPDVVEQIASRPALIESPAVVEVIDRLYWDTGADRPKRGFTSTERAPKGTPAWPRKVPSPGTLRALELVLSNLQCTFDLRSMTADQILVKLPNEFKPWLQGSSSPNRKKAGSAQ